MSTRKKDLKFSEKKISVAPRHRVEIVAPKRKPFDLNKPGQYGEYWQRAAAAAKEMPK